MKITKAKTTVYKNAYFSQKWGVIIEEEGTVLTIDCPVVAEVPDNMKVC